MNSNKINVTLSAIILFFTVFGFVWLFASASVKNTDTTQIDTKYKTVDITSIKKDITDLLAERQNAGGMPIPSPTSKMGKENPFSSL